jgi:hypothetical protein
VLGSVLCTCGADTLTCAFGQMEPPEVLPEGAVTTALWFQSRSLISTPMIPWVILPVSPWYHSSCHLAMDAFVASFLSIPPVMGARSSGNSSGFSLALFAILSASAIPLFWSPPSLHPRSSSAPCRWRTILGAFLWVQGKSLWIVRAPGASWWSEN